MSREITLEAFKKWQDVCEDATKDQKLDSILRREDCGLGDLPADGVFPMMALDFTRELRNTINRFYLHIFYGDCWFQVARTYPAQERASLIYEFADPNFELALNKPYALKSHFVHAGTHILHRSNRLVDNAWKDELPEDRRIDIRTLREKGKFWKSFPAFESSLALLDDKAFRSATMNFRNLFNHQYELNIDRGLYPFFERRNENGTVVYEYKVANPLRIEDLVPTLYQQHSVAVQAFKAFFSLLLEQIAVWPPLKKTIHRKGAAS